MTILQNNFFALLSTVVQYQIPIYQRNYAWGKDNCDKLLKDIIKAGTPGNANHYVGSIIVKEEPVAGGVKIYNVIDGQQRITTITLLLLALENYWKENPDSGVSETTSAILGSIKNICLVNDALRNTSLFTKVLPKDGPDRQEYTNLLHDVIGDGKMSANYNFFLKTLKEKSCSLSIVFDGINNAQLALVSLNSDENPQLLFEAVNDTGVDLTKVDLVRNWVFMGLPGVDQNRLYREYWSPIESVFYENVLNNFLFYYTRIKAVTSFDENEYYRVFKKTFILSSGNVNGIERILKEIKQYAGLYAKYLDGSFKNKEINTLLKNIANTGKAVFIPLILKILNQWDKKRISTEETISMLRYLESYIVRRDILRIPTKSLGSVMVLFLSHSDSLADFVECINNLSWTHRMPDDKEMLNYLQYSDFFSLGSSMYYLERIEKHLNPAFALEDPTIEHILPETMHTTAFPKDRVSNPVDFNWELDLGTEAQVIHDRFQHTLGNLTILPRGENARMGDYRFEKKRDWRCSAPDGFNYGYRYTPIRISQSLGNFNAWNEESILKRCEEMVGYICTVWPHP